MAIPILSCGSVALVRVGAAISRPPFGFAEWVAACGDKENGFPRQFANWLGMTRFLEVRAMSGGTGKPVPYGCGAFAP